MNMVTILMWTTRTMLEVEHVINHIWKRCNLFLYTFVSLKCALAYRHVGTGTAQGQVVRPPKVTDSKWQQSVQWN